MSLKYKCPECGTPLGFEGLCWHCRAKQYRKEVANWTAQEVEEKINQVLAKLRISTEDDFYSSKECEILDNLMTKGVVAKQIAEAACEREIFYPSHLYYKAGENVRDKLIEKIMTTKDSNEAGSLLRCLAMVGDKKAQDALYELKINLRPWRKKLFVDADVYAEEGGWTFDSNNNCIKLNYDKCFAFVEGDKKEENGTFIARKRGEKCPHCGCELMDILVIDGRDERFSFLGLDGIITASCCPNCVSMTDEISNKFTLDGKSEILAFDGTDENYCRAEDIELMVENKLVVSVDAKPVFYGGFNSDVNTIGGFASWVQDWEYRKCPECGKKMKYLAQIHWDTIMDCAEGTLYVEICPECRIITMFHQQT